MLSSIDSNPFPYSVFLIKPDAVRRHLTGEILATIEASGLEISALLMIPEADRSDVLRHYEGHRGQPYFTDLVNSIIGQRIVVGTVLDVKEPAKTVERLRALIGPYREPRRGCIRGDYALSERENSIHGSDSPEEALREALIWITEPT